MSSCDVQPLCLGPGSQTAANVDAPLSRPHSAGGATDLKGLFVVSSPVMAHHGKLTPLPTGPKNRVHIPMSGYLITF